MFTMHRLRYSILVIVLLASACRTPDINDSPTGIDRQNPDTYKLTATIGSITTDDSPDITGTRSPTVNTNLQNTDTPTSLKPTTLLFTGIIVPARCVQATIDSTGNPDYPYEKIREITSGADLSISTLNATMSDRVEHTGCNWSYQMVGGSSNADAMARAGFDVISVATNHIKDCGLMKSWCDYAFLDTLENLRRVGILPIGAGKNLEEALQPVVETVNGIRFGFVSLGDSKMDDSVFATQNDPGIARLTEENLKTAIASARQVADVVIALPHWGPENVSLPNGIQRNQARQFVEAGADLVVGNHAHVVQAIQEIDGVPVFYGLGNFVFDQWYPQTRQGVILLVKFQGTKYLGYELIPTHVDQDGQVFLAGAEEATEILERIEEASQQLK
jgi:poly-gamma-glutamate capsule biosynthesis protein CapA/YwtB (metallophosphatase superfamily)